MKPEIDRRREARYRLGEGAIAVWANNLGQILDISSGGVSFAYMPSDDAPPQNSSTVDILDGQHTVFLEGLPCRVVFQKMQVNETFYSLVRMVQCSLEFGVLTPRQQAALEGYLRAYPKEGDCT